MIEEQQSNSSEALKLVLQTVEQQSSISELEQKLAQEKATVEAAGSAINKMLTGDVTEDIILDTDVGSKVIKALDPKNAPGLEVNTQWSHLFDSHTGNQSDPHITKSGGYSLKVDFGGKESYLCVQVYYDKIEKVTISSKPLRDPLKK